MNQAVESFGDALRGAGVGLFFYEGHGIQHNGANYLLPVEADPRAANELPYKALNAGLVLAKMETVGPPVNLVVLDACRNNPLNRSWRSASRGLANMVAPRGTKIIYANRPNEEAGAPGYVSRRVTERMGPGKERTVVVGLDREAVGTPPVPASREPKPGEVAEGPLGMTFAWIPAGEFMREGNRVTLTRGFWMQTTELTQGQWKAVMGNNPSNFKNCGDKCPVQQVYWEDAQEFLKKLNARHGGEYRLPTEAEWEYAAGSGDKEEKYAGTSSDERLAEYANFCDRNCTYDWKDGNQNDGYETTAPVASFKPNGFGLYDMSGNVWEWCADWYGDYPSGAVNPTGPSSGASRVLRGGSWYNGARNCRSADRGHGSPDYRGSNGGLRLVARRPAQF